MDYPAQESSERGGTFDVRDKAGLTARVVGAAGFSQPRTFGPGAHLSVSLYYLPSASDPLNAFEQAIDSDKPVVISR